MKRTNSTGNWQLVDNRRVGYNPSNNLLFPDGSDAEAAVTDNDILCNGFKLRTTGAGRNGSGSTYIYMAFAEAPFKYANARQETIRWFGNMETHISKQVEVGLTVMAQSILTTG